MRNTKKLPFDRCKFHLGFRFFTAVLMVVSFVVFVGLGFSIQYQDLKSTYSLAVETTTFLKAECEKYENYQRGISSRALQDLLDHAYCLKRFAGEESLADADFLKSFIHTEHVGGVLVVDADFNLLAQADMDGQSSYTLWKETLQKEAIQDIFRYPTKTYVDHTTLYGDPYDFAVAANNDGTKLILCYASTAKPASDPYELTISSVLANNNFHKNPTVVISDGTQILSTNDPIVAELGSSQYNLLSRTVDWKDDALTRFRYNNNTFYGLRRVYGGYNLYAVYSSKEVFTDRTNFIIIAFMFYLLISMHYLFAQRHVDKDNLNRMQKQLRIINAISTSYSSTFLLHIDRMELEAIHPSARLKAAFEEHPNPYDFLFHVCQQYVTPEHRGIILDFLELKTLAQRLKGVPYLGNEVKDSSGVWYSVMLIPQRYDAEGNVQAILVTTQNVTSIKQAEELSFNDKLTGLHNRNYMESRSETFVRKGELPVSLIMADCDCLKQTNDRLGHEAGDALLKQVAAAIQETLPQNSVAMRVGGDEFLLLCPQCPADAAARLVEALKAALARRSTEALPLSVSFGAYTVTSESISFHEAYTKADEAMYQEKVRFHQGRR